MKFSNIPVLDQDGVYMEVVIIAIITEINTYDLCTSLNITLGYKNKNKHTKRGVGDSPK